MNEGLSTAVLLKRARRAITGLRALGQGQPRLLAYANTFEQLLDRYPAPDESCVWTTDVWDDSPTYQTGCQQEFVLLEPHSLEEHGFKFCLYCGKPVTEVRIDRYAKEDV